MMKRLVVRVYVLSGLVAFGALLASPAQAQYRPRPVADPATGETYHIEFSAGYWNPSADITVASEQLGIVGTNIDFKKDLGLTDQRFPALNLVLRPSKKLKFRFEYLPMRYDSSAILRRVIVFNGIAYVVGLPVDSTLDWKTYRVGLEYDFVSRDRGFAGLLLDVKFMDITVNLRSPIANEFARARAPIPGLGGIARVYVMPNISITGAVSGFTLPDSLLKRFDANGHYVDFDIYGTVNVTNNIGAQFGYRSLDESFGVKTDSGSLKFGGLYVGAVVRY
jgi:hypothetical protein